MTRETRTLLAGALLALLALLLVLFRDGGIDRILSAREFTGPARVVDGDSLEIVQHRVRLFGIDAPEIGQTCYDRAGRDYACGERARDALEAAIGAQLVTCVSEGRDRFQRVLARCRRPDGEDLGAMLVRAGWAVAYAGPDGERYRAIETDAARRRAGMWTGRFERPDAWRRDHPAR